MAEVIIVLSSDEESSASNSNTNGANFNIRVSNVTSEQIEKTAESERRNNLEDSKNSISQPDVFEEFLKICRCHITDSGELKILNRLNERYQKVAQQCRSSEEFIEFVNKLKSDLTKEPKNIFLYILKLSDYIKLRRKLHEKNILDRSEIKKEPDDSTCEPSIVTNGENSKEHLKNGAECSKIDDTAKRKRQIQRLEKLLRILSKKIKKLEERELDFDQLDDDDSYYLQEDRYKKRFVQVWNTLSKLQNWDGSTGRHVQKKFKYKGSRYPEINVKVTKWINKYKQFPEFAEVLELVTKVSSKNNLHLKSQQMHDIAQDVFSDVGKELRSRRIMDFHDFLDTFPSPTQDDPADADPNLASTLEENRIKSQQSIDQVLDYYTQKQFSMQPTASDRDSSIPNENGEPNPRNEISENENEIDADEESEVSEKCDNIETIADEFEDELDKYDHETANNLPRSEDEETEEYEEDSDDESDDNQNSFVSAWSTNPIEVESIPKKRRLSNDNSEPSTSSMKMRVVCSPYVQSANGNLTSNEEIPDLKFVHGIPHLDKPSTSSACNFSKEIEVIDLD